MYAPIPQNEDARIEALKGYEILDTADEAAYDDIVQLAASICNTPMAAISLVDDYRQWFKARVGIGFRDSDRDMSICAHAILKPEQTLVVVDTLMDERFSLNQFVVSKPNIRFYVGVPLVNPEGMVLGTLCVMDRDSRGITPLQIGSLQVLARQVIALMELRRSRIGLRRQADLLARLMEIAPVVDSTISILVRDMGDLRDEPNLTSREKQIVEKVDNVAKGMLRAIANLQNAKPEAPKASPVAYQAEAPKPASNIAPPPPVPPTNSAPTPAPNSTNVETISYKPKPVPQPAPSITRRRENPKVLVADDNEMNCIVLTSILENNGCEVVCVENGEDALQRLATDRFDLVFMDIQMPRLDGMQTSRTIRRMPYPICNVPIVAMCAGIIRDEESQARGAGMNDFVNKPISEKSVCQALNRWLVRTDVTALI